MIKKYNQYIKEEIDIYEKKSIEVEIRSYNEYIILLQYLEDEDFTWINGSKPTKGKEYWVDEEDNILFIRYNKRMISFLIDDPVRFEINRNQYSHIEDIVSEEYIEKFKKNQELKLKNPDIDPLGEEDWDV